MPHIHTNTHNIQSITKPSSFYRVDGMCWNFIESLSMGLAAELHHLISSGDSYVVKQAAQESARRH